MEHGFSFPGFSSIMATRFFARGIPAAIPGLLLIIGLVAGFPAKAQDDTFIVNDIRLQGLQRVSAGSVFNLLPLNVGDRADVEALQDTTRSLFASGFFDDILLLRDEDVLVVEVRERPSISTIAIEGNKSIKTEALLEGLANSGLAANEILKRALLERVEMDLLRQYVGQGRYATTVKTQTEVQPGNRVGIKVLLAEGDVAKIARIILIGNESYDDKKITGLFELKQPGAFSFLTGDNKFSREKLAGDIERLESFYQDRGYVDFQILSAQVSVTPDKQEVYITISMQEGNKYLVSDVQLVGDLGEVSPRALESLLQVRSGDVFSRARITASEELLTTVLGNSGYTFANVSGIPENDGEGRVKVRFFVEAGKRVYVQRIDFTGNTITKDSVLRRESRQQEGGWASNAQIEQSKIRMERLGFFKEVSVDTVKVPDADDQIDILFNVAEHPSGSISAGIGYIQQSGLLLSANYQENNLLGSGNALNLAFSWNSFQRAINLSHFNPYYTPDGISRNLNLYLRETDFGQNSNLVGFVTDSLGAGFSFGYPISETQRVRFGLSVDNTNIKSGTSINQQEIRDFLSSEGNRHLNLRFDAAWSSSTLNRGIFATAGSSQYLGIEATVPGGDLEYYKITYSGQLYVPLHRLFSLRFRANLGYGGAYGNTREYPFYEHFYAGGFGSVRGFENNSLGPRSTSSINPASRGFTFGGNLMMVGNAELLLNVPLSQSGGSFRPALFFDIGQVFNTNCPEYAANCFGFDQDEFRYSVGLGITWLSPLGPMTFSLSSPLNKGPLDNTESFQFELGRSF